LDLTRTPLKALAGLPALLAEPRRLRAVSADIHSILPADAGPQMYDRRAVIYDRVVGTRVYNRVMWGTSPGDMAELARRAVLERQDAWLIDAAGGSLLFSADLYLEHRSRPVLVLDQSVAMLQLARRRLMERGDGTMPEHVVLLQGDLRQLDAFVPASIGTVLCLNVLHHIDAGAALIAGLSKLLAPRGGLYATSLITSGRWSDAYLKSLHRSGVVVQPRSREDVERCFADAHVGPITSYRRGNMLYVTA
jgi:SAM-dependent methyltransferase